MRVPMMLRWPGKIAPRRCDLLISIPDLYPTLLDLMGLNDAVDVRVQGTSHATYTLTGEGPKPSSQLYIKIPFDKPDYGKRGVRTLRYKLILTRNSPDSDLLTQLYDLQNDPYELKDIAARSHFLVETLTQEELRPWLERTEDPFLEQLPAYGSRA